MWLPAFLAVDAALSASRLHIVPRNVPNFCLDKRLALWLAVSSVGSRAPQDSSGVLRRSSMAPLVKSAVATPERLAAGRGNRRLSHSQVVVSFGKVTDSGTQSFPRRRESIWKDDSCNPEWRQFGANWIPAFAGMTASEKSNHTTTQGHQTPQGPNNHVTPGRGAPRTGGNKTQTLRPKPECSLESVNGPVHTTMSMILKRLSWISHDIADKYGT